jgi:hypothetical protein
VRYDQKNMTSAIETPSVPAMVQLKKPQATTKGRKGFKGRVDMPRTWLAFMDTAFEESQCERCSLPKLWCDKKTHLVLNPFFVFFV